MNCRTFAHLPSLNKQKDLLKKINWQNPASFCLLSFFNNATTKEIKALLVCLELEPGVAGW